MTVLADNHFTPVGAFDAIFFKLSARYTISRGNTVATIASTATMDATTNAERHRMAGSTMNEATKCTGSRGIINDVCSR